MKKEVNKEVKRRERNKLALKAQKSLKCVDRFRALALIDRVNLQDLERTLVIRFELGGEQLEKIACSLFHGKRNEKMYSYSHCATVKQQALVKIGEYLEQREKRIKKNVGLTDFSFSAPHVNTPISNKKE